MTHKTTEKDGKTCYLVEREADIFPKDHEPECFTVNYGSGQCKDLDSGLGPACWWIRCTSSKTPLM